jgi:hypothetical protein
MNWSCDQVSSGALMGLHRSHTQVDRVIALIAATLARSRITVGTLLVLVLALGWDVQRAWCATPADVRLVALARSKFAHLTKAELALLRFVGANPAPGGGFAAAGPSSNRMIRATTRRTQTNGVRIAKSAPKCSDGCASILKRSDASTQRDCVCWGPKS